MTHPRDREQADDRATGAARDRSPRRDRLTIGGGVALLVAAALAVLGLLLHQRSVEAEQRRDLSADRARGLRVAVTTIETTPAARNVNLPGDVRGYSQATLYAKISGYVREVLVERGDHVRRGQVLATIEAPENQEDLAFAERTAQIARVNAQRAESLAPAGVVAAQDRDNAVAQARISQANFSRARAIYDYSVVRAPFDGVVSARYVDPGALLAAATGGTQSALPLVDLTSTERLRILVYVGQDAAPFVRPGDDVTIWQEEIPSKRIASSVTRTAGALDPRTRTMQVEIDLDNTTWGLLPGTFARVELRIAEPPTPLAPDAAIVIRDGKTMVTEVRDGHAHYVPVELGDNDGRRVRVLRGLAGGETVGLDVPLEVGDGDPVQATKR